MPKIVAISALRLYKVTIPKILRNSYSGCRFYSFYSNHEKINSNDW